MLRLRPFFVLPLLSLALPHVAAVDVYGQQGIFIPGTTTPQEDWLLFFSAYNNITLTPPPLPQDVPSNVPMVLTKGQPSGASIPQRGSFFGFSIEMSVVTQVIGINSSYIFPPFLNLLAAIADRAGEVHVRYGGNTQEYATLVDSLPNGHMTFKNKGNTKNPTETPELQYTEELIHLLATVSSFVNVRWYLGIPMNDTTKPRLRIAEVAERLLGDKIVGFQVGNEPDLYADHGHRDKATYDVKAYSDEIGVMNDAIKGDPLIKTRNNLILPSLQGRWPMKDLWDNGYFDRFRDDIGIVTAERYPNDDCARAFPEAGFGPPKDPQTELPKFLSHGAVLSLAHEYTEDSGRVQAIGKPFMMFETNTASCGGIRGISDAFAASLWGIDWGMQLAYNNFSGAMFHVGGQSVSYNPFTPPPTNLTSFKQWTVGPVFYTSLFMAEALGKTGQSRVLEVTPQNNDVNPMYAVYENNELARLVVINFMSKQNDRGDINVALSIGGGESGEGNGTPATLKVKYLTAPDVANKNNITWAGQTFGGRFEGDGRLRGTEDVRTINCDVGTNVCNIPVPAPAVALIFISQDAQNTYDPAHVATFGTTAATKRINTITVDPQALETSNGDGRRSRVGGTSNGAGLLGLNSAASRNAVAVVGMTMLSALLAGAFVVAR